MYPEQGVDRRRRSEGATGERPTSNVERGQRSEDGGQRAEDGGPRRPEGLRVNTELEYRNPKQIQNAKS